MADSDVLRGLLDQQGVNSAVGSGVSSPVWNWSDFLLGGKNTKTGMQTNGALGFGLSALQGLGNLYMGMKQYGLAKDQLQFSKDAFNKNFAVQAQMTNSNLEDRQRARVASNPGAYQSVGDYMAQNRVVA